MKSKWDKKNIWHLAECQAHRKPLQQGSYSLAIGPAWGSGEPSSPLGLRLPPHTQGDTGQPQRGTQKPGPLGSGLGLSGQRSCVTGCGGLDWSSVPRRPAHSIHLFSSGPCRCLGQNPGSLLDSDRSGLYVSRVLSPLTSPASTLHSFNCMSQTLGLLNPLAWH